MRYDLAVIGSGSGAFATAIAARRKGKSVVMIERGTVGGTCVNTGCVPSKALLAAAEARHLALSPRFPGIATSAAPVDTAALIQGKADLVTGLRAEKYVDLAAEHGWEILPGTARFADGEGEPTLDVRLVDGAAMRVRAEHVVIATGSAPWTPPLPGLAGIDYLTSTTAMELPALPASLVVIGAGYVGLEQAQLFARLGVEVSIVGRFAPHTEPELAAILRGVFTDDGISVHDERAVRVEATDTGIRVSTMSGEHVGGQRLLMATGRRPVTAGLNLQAVGVTTGDRGQVVVDGQLRTGNPRIWAVGDVTGHPQFVYVAGAHGSVVADNAFDNAGRTLDYHHLPAVTFTAPSLASAGLTDTQAVARGYACECRVLPLAHVPRALVNRDIRGAIKLVADRDSGRLLGAHVLAAGAGDVIAAAVYALAGRMTVTQMAELWCPYLTMAEGIKLAAQTYSRDVTTLSCCAS